MFKFSYVKFSKTKKNYSVAVFYVVKNKDFVRKQNHGGYATIASKTRVLVTIIGFDFAIMVR